jgi:hypothetical protein
MTPLFDTQHNNIKNTTLSINDTWRNVTGVVMLGVALFHFYAKCHYAECHYAECHYAECRYAKCHYAECCGAQIMISFKIAFCSKFSGTVFATLFSS